MAPLVVTILMESSPVNCDLLFIVPSGLINGVSAAKLEAYLCGILESLSSLGGGGTFLLLGFKVLSSLGGLFMTDLYSPIGTVVVKI